MPYSPVQFIRMFLPVMFLLAATCATAQPGLMHADPGSAQRSNLGPQVNSGNVELMPLMSSDGRTLYFDRKYDPANVGGSEDADDIYYSTLLPDGTWSPARNIGRPLNTPGSDVMLWLSSDGSTALVHNGAEVKGRELGLAISRKGKNGKWGKPKAISILGIKDLTEYGAGYSAYISADGRRLILAMARDTSNPENTDLLSCKALGSDYLRWGAPETLGDTVNTILYEWAPYLAPDNVTLYFASGGHFGFGASDVYMARRLDDSWRRWSEPVNIGPTVNTTVYEASIAVAPDGTGAYIAAEGYDTVDVSYGNTDIFHITLPESLRPYPVVTVTGTVKAAGRGVRALVRAVDSASGSEVASMLSDGRGAFRINLIGGRAYRITAWAQGHDEVARDIGPAELKAAAANLTLDLSAPKGSRAERPQ